VSATLEAPLLRSLLLLLSERCRRAENAKAAPTLEKVLLDVRSQNAVTIWPTIRALLPAQLQNLGNFNFNLIYLNKIYFHFEMQRQKGGE